VLGSNGHSVKRMVFASRIMGDKNFRLRGEPYLKMMFKQPNEDYKSNPIVLNALDNY